jgi:glycine oxidase
MSDCLVIGGGIIGMMSARMLAMIGMEVTLLERIKCGRESSWASGGIISPLYPWKYDDMTNKLSFESQKYYKTLCADLNASSGIDIQYKKIGLLMMDEFETLKAKAWIKKHKITYDKHAKGALFKNVANLKSPKLLEALKIDIINKGVKVIENTQVKGLIIKDKKVLGVKTIKEKFFADNIVNCCGAWSGELSPLKDNIFPIKGQIILINAEDINIKHIILNKGCYIIPRINNRILVGSTMENVGFNRINDNKTKQNLYNFAVQHLNSLKNAKIENHWSGFRPASKSGKIIIRRDEKYNNLFINTGHFSNGINTAPASANQIIKLINE